MAAVTEASFPELVELRQLRPDDLQPLLEEEARCWRRQLSWEFEPSAELVRRFLRMQALSGYTLLQAGRPIGYTYYVCEDRKGLIGDLYVMERHATAGNEHRLLSAVLYALQHNASVRRIESQLMMLRHDPQENPLLRQGLHRYPRHFMMANLAHAHRMAPSRHHAPIAFDMWSGAERKQEEVAQLIADAYQNHIDSQINDQYRTVSGARRFLLNIVQYPGCGSFFQPASYVAYQPVTGRLLGVVLSSQVANDVGHITQICVAPDWRGSGVGYELLRLAMRSLAEHGYQKVSLTVTSHNERAIQLYEGAGFQQQQSFSACVWEGF